MTTVSTARLSKLLRRLGLGKEDAEDVVQDTLLKGLLAGAVRSPGAWAARAARNAGLNRLAANRVRGRTAPPDDLPAPAAPDADSAERREAVEAVRAAVGRLPAAQRAAVRLAMAGRTRAEAAALAGVSARTARRHLRAALAALRAELRHLAD